MKQTLLILFTAVALLSVPLAGLGQSTSCDSLSLPYSESFISSSSTLPPCWTYNSTYVTWNGPSGGGNGELFFKANSAGQAAVLPNLNYPVSKTGLTFKAKCGTPAEGDGILVGVANDNGTLIEWLDTIIDPNHSRNAWVEHTFYFTRYTVTGTRIALGRLWNTSDGSKWVAIDDIEAFALPSCYPPEDLVAENLGDPDATAFDWNCFGSSTQWQVYVDTITANIDTVAESRLDSVNTTYYTIPSGRLVGGGKYRFYVRSVCDLDNSPWVSYEFGAGTYVMNNTGAADAITRCGLVVYDNGGPVAGYLENSNSTLVIYPEGIGNQLEVYGAIFGFGSSGASLTIYDGNSTSGTQLYNYSVASGRDTLTTTLCTSTQGALTIRFTSTGNMAHTGYELYVRCTSEPSCPRPVGLTATALNATTAKLTWQGATATHKVYHRRVGTGSWSVHTVTADSVTLNGLMVGAEYEAYVKSLCGSTDTSLSSSHIFFTMPETDVDPDCPVPSDVVIHSATATTATVGWTSTASRWQIECGDITMTTSSNPTTIIGLEPQTQYDVRVRTVCDGGGKSDWSDAIRFSTTSTEGIQTADYNTIGLYPNPASKMITVTLPEGGAVVTVNDALGRTSGVWRVEGSELRLDVSDMARGTYFVRVATEGTVAVRKLILQ